jgi:RNA recognition motif-containing protein
MKMHFPQIPKDMDEDILLPFFSEFGPVAELTIIRDKMSQAHKGVVAAIDALMYK